MRCSPLPIACPTDQPLATSIPKTKQDLQKLRIVDLLHLAKRQGIRIPSRANKGHLVDRLFEYATLGPESIILPILRRPHKGPRCITRLPKRMKLSAKRAQRLIPPETPSLPASSSSRNGWIWANEVLSRQGPGERIVSLADQAPVAIPMQESISADGVANGSSGELRPHSSEQMSMSTATTATPRPQAATPPYQQAASPSIIPRLFAPPSTTQSPPGLVAPYTLTLGGGLQLHYGREDCRRPTSLSGLISNIPLLYSVWDDSAPTWGNASPLTIQGCPIAIKYWREFYKFRAPRIWSELKQTWSSFKILMDEYVKGGEANFMSIWSKDGKLMASHCIIKALRLQRREECKLKAEMTRHDSGSSFENSYSYQKGNRRMVLKDPLAIVRRKGKVLYNSDTSVSIE